MTRPAVQQPLNPGEVFLGANRYRLKPGTTVTRKRVTQVAAPIRTGPPQFGDDQVASSVIWEDLTGGVGVITMDEATSPDRFTDSSLDTRTRNQITLLPKRNLVTQAGAAFSSTPVGACDLGIYTYVVGGTTLKRLTGAGPTMSYYDTGTTAWVTSGGTEYALPGSANARPIVWKGNVWIPCGASGTARINVAAATIATIATMKALYFFIFDEDLCWIDSDGAVKSTDDNSTTPTLVARGSLDTFSTITGAVVGKNLNNDPAPWIASDRGLHAVDYFAGKVYGSGVAFTDGSPYNGRGLTAWDGDLWFGKGANAHQVTSGSRVVRGPSTGDGLLVDKQGHVVDFETAFDNFLPAVIDAGDFGTSSVMAYNRRGFHTLAQPTPVTGNIAAEAFGFDVVGVAEVGYADIGAPRTAAYDDFDDADSAVSLGTAIIGGAWTAGVGTWGISSNKAYLTAATANAVATVTTTVANCLVQAVFSTSVADQRLVFRLSDTSNYLYVERTSTGYSLCKRDTGVNSTLIAYATTPADGDKITVSLSGSTVRVRVNSSDVISTTTSFNSTAVKHGLGSASSASPRWNDFVVGSGVRRISFCHYSQLTVPGYFYFNEGTDLVFVKLFDTTDNPYQAAVSEYESSGALTLPWFDANLANVTKTAVNIEVRTLDTSATATVTISYAIDDDDDWTIAYDVNGVQNSVSAPGVTKLYLDTDQLGTLFRNFRLKIEMNSSTASVSPKLVFVKVRYLREFDILFGYDFELDLSGPQPDETTAASAIENLTALNTSKLLTQFAYHSGKSTDTKVVKMFQFSGPTGSANTRTGTAFASLIEVEPQA